MATTVRPATLADVPALAVMGARFLAASPFAAAVPPNGLEGPVGDVVQRGFAVVAEDGGGNVVGMLLGTISAPWWAPSVRWASELAWWVEPEHRGGGAAVRMLRQFHAWAAACGVDGCAASDLVVDGVPSADALLRRCGYRVVERSHYREVS